MNITCELFPVSDIEHLHQIYAGYNILHQNGYLKLSQTISDEFLQNKNNPDRWTDYKFFNTKVIVNKKIAVTYDTHDWNRIDENILRESDFYFKRSFDENYVSTLDEKEKVFPLGLNYSVSSSTRDFFRLQRSRFYDGKDKIKTIAKSLKIAESVGKSGEAEQIKNLEAYPDFSLEPKILFMARVWDTGKILSKDQKEFVEQINETRAECVRALRKEFGKHFFGGLARDQFSEKYFGDVLLSENELTKKRNYLEMLKHFPICVATTGLNNSIGWKLGEYVALSKAILSEPLFFKIPGDFVKEKNYLEFTSPDELINAAVRLFEDRVLRYEMMMNNYAYYHSYVRPDSLIMQSLKIVFVGGKI